jgi:hypothetical protein
MGGDRVWIAGSAGGVVSEEGQGKGRWAWATLPFLHIHIRETPSDTAICRLNNCYCSVFQKYGHTEFIYVESNPRHISSQQITELFLNCSPLPVTGTLFSLLQLKILHNKTQNKILNLLTADITHTGSGTALSFFSAVLYLAHMEHAANSC